MLEVRDKGSETNALYDIDTAPSGVKVIFEDPFAIVAIVRRSKVRAAINLSGLVLPLQIPSAACS